MCVISRNRMVIEDNIVTNQQLTQVVKVLVIITDRR